MPVVDLSQASGHSPASETDIMHGRISLLLPFLMTCWLLSVTSLPALAGKTQLRSGGMPQAGSNKVLLKFPAQSIGCFWVVRPRGNLLAQDGIITSKAYAVGTVQIPADCMIYLKLNYFGATNCSALTSIPGDYIRKLELGSLEVEDKDAAVISALPHLAYLDANGTDLTDLGVKQFGRLSELQSLNLSFLRISSASVEALSKLRNLERLTFSSTKLGDGVAPHLVKIKSLKILGLTSCFVTDKTVAELSQLPDLVELFLSRNNVTDACIDSILKMKKLKRLHLADTRVTVKGLCRLKALPELSVLLLRLRERSPAELKLLRQALPKVTLEEGSKEKDIDSSLFAPVH